MIVVLAKFRNLLALALVLALASAVSGQSVTASDEAKLTQRIEALLRPLYPPDEPGAAVLASRDGEVVFRGSYGLAHMELGVAVQPEMVFCLASVTKCFTAVGTMILEEEGELDLHEQITDYLPMLARAEGVTIEHLLSHTSGIRDMGSMPGYMTEKIHVEVTPDDLIATIADQALLFEPGQEFRYSNANYAILGRLIEIITDQTWEEFLRERIFEPAGMHSTLYGGHQRVLPGAVSGYAESEGVWERSAFLSYTRGFGLGGLFSSVDDLSAWHDALVGGEIVGEDTLGRMFEPFELNDGKPGGYGLGFFISDTGGRRVVHHGGGIMGWRTYAMMLPESGIFVAVLTNREKPGDNPQQVAAQIAKVLVEPGT